MSIFECHEVLDILLCQFVINQQFLRFLINPLRISVSLRGWDVRRVLLSSISTEEEFMIIVDH